jgi:site-specific DNA-cytosine methylase
MDRMKHLGDICGINGAEIPAVDVITGGSPCQDLSIAGNRKGLSGERSGLFMEQIRVIKEMMEADRKRGRSGEFIRCRYAIWENVPGAMSSNKGRDFQAVLTEFVRVAEPYAPDVPMPDKGKWPKSGWLYDEMGRWSVAWRMHDAQFWGVPQRRKRIALVADFNGLTAPDILFYHQYRRETEGTDADEAQSDPGGECGREVQAQCESVSGNPEPGGTTREGTSKGVEGSTGGTDTVFCLQGNGIGRSDDAGCEGTGWRRGGSYAINTTDRHAISFRERA